MSGVPKIAIAESIETLKSLMKQQKSALNYAKVQALYLLKINAVETVRYLAVIMGRSESLARSLAEETSAGSLVNSLLVAII